MARRICMICESEQDEFVGAIAEFQLPDGRHYVDAQRRFAPYLYCCWHSTGSSWIGGLAGSQAVIYTAWANCAMTTDREAYQAMRRPPREGVRISTPSVCHI